jgi:hypothetical protein
MSDLFAEAVAPASEAAAAAPSVERFDWYQAFAEKHRSVPPGWRWFRVQTLNHQAPRDQQTVLMEGGVAPKKTRGKYAGRPDWKARDKSLDRTLALTFAELEQFQRDWETETGKCAQCYGTGRGWAGWSSAEGDRYADCRPCDATGKPRARQ